MAIKFGTDGWRAVIAEDFTFENVRLVSQAAANFINSDLRGSGDASIVIGFDTRFLSDRFAAAVAEVMAGNGIKVWLTRADAPTPSVSYNVVDKGATAGVMITASHNPPRYNGFKLKSANGSSASPDVCKKVEANLAELLKKGAKPQVLDFLEAEKAGMITRFDPAWTYYEHLQQLIDMDAISLSEAHVIADPMFGSGRGSLTAILARTRCHVTEIRGDMNPGFDGIHPEPIAKHLKDLMAIIRRDYADVGLATDGDADRIGAVDHDGKFVDPHTIMALSARYLVEKRGMSGAIVKTVSTTAMLNRIAQKYKLPIHETPVGFNHIADMMINGDVLIGGEESGGISIKGHIPEGDGILMALVILEIMGAYNAPLGEIIRDLQINFGPTVYERRDLHLKQVVDKKEMVKRLTDAAPKSMGGESIKEVLTLDGVKFILADDSWLLIRPSGTEPMLRVYAEGTSKGLVEDMLGCGQTMAGVE